MNTYSIDIKQNKEFYRIINLIKTTPIALNQTFNMFLITSAWTISYNFDNTCQDFLSWIFMRIRKIIFIERNLDEFSHFLALNSFELAWFVIISNDLWERVSLHSLVSATQKQLLSWLKFNKGNLLVKSTKIIIFLLACK